MTTNRRQFITQTAVAGSALMIPGVLSSFTRISTNPLVSSPGIKDSKLLQEGWKIAPAETGTIGSSFLTSADNEWYSIPSMPAMPHKILLHHNKIEEPWKPFGMEKCYWVSKKGWLYSWKDI